MKPGTTSLHDALRKGIEDAIDRLRGIGIRHFCGAPATAAWFPARLPAKRNGSGEDEEEPPETEEEKENA